MVKPTFNSSLGQKEPKKEEENIEALIVPVEKDTDEVINVRRQSKAWCWCMCLGLALMLSGVVVGGAYLYRYFVFQDDLSRPFICGVDYQERDFIFPDIDLPTPAGALRRIEERIQFLENEQVELINVPVPEFADSDPADIVHDFHRKLTAYLDLSLNKCYVIPLNTSIVMPPRDFRELLINIKAGTYLPQSYLIHEQMVVTDRIENVDQLGYFIYSVCRGKETFKLQRRDSIIGIQKREALNCNTICHFENTFVVKTVICQQ
ncbi:integral membrane protein 2Bb [Erpetoichthys calabaricus]|uniref:Integral membrane protein 2 n=1 Tax=Erpetoichthys calabaricus TaxID=27687 RepID=A0A8C4RYG6_ERPCA|nr:integral membrane protein 2Bb [Erpetoichthys calabaricus]